VQGTYCCTYKGAKQCMRAAVQDMLVRQRVPGAVYAFMLESVSEAAAA
jgi:hypothetical protein